MRLLRNNFQYGSVSMARDRRFHYYGFKQMLNNLYKNLYELFQRRSEVAFIPKCSFDIISVTLLNYLKN